MFKKLSVTLPVSELNVLLQSDNDMKLYYAPQSNDSLYWHCWPRKPEEVYLGNAADFFIQAECLDENNETVGQWPHYSSELTATFTIETTEV